MTNVVPIVEGDGEVEALPVLLRRLGTWLTPEVTFKVLPPLRVRKDRFLQRDEEFKKMLLLAAMKAETSGLILILLDADDDCPKELGAEILKRAQAEVPHCRVSVTLANREYEAWFIAAAASLHGKRELNVSEHVADPESIRGAKEWLGRQMPRGRKYYEKADQPAMSALMDLELARARSRSFRKLCTEWQKFLT